MVKKKSPHSLVTYRESIFLVGKKYYNFNTIPLQTWQKSGVFKTSLSQIIEHCQKLIPIYSVNCSVNVQDRYAGYWIINLHKAAKIHTRIKYWASRNRQSPCVVNRRHWFKKNEVIFLQSSCVCWRHDENKYRIKMPNCILSRWLYIAVWLNLTGDSVVQHENDAVSDFRSRQSFFFVVAKFLITARSYTRSWVQIQWTSRNVTFKIKGI